MREPVAVSPGDAPAATIADLGRGALGYHRAGCD
jgi:hypothetical protein